MHIERIDSDFSSKETFGLLKYVYIFKSYAKLLER